MRMDGGLWVPGAAAPGTPSSGNILYPKSDNRWYTKDASGNETMVGTKDVPTPTTSTDAANKAYVDGQIAAMSPTGQRLGSSIRTTPLTAAVNSTITGLSVAITGAGRYVDVELFLPALWHATAATFMNAAILVNGVATQLSQAISYVNTGGPGVYVCLEQLLTLSTAYTFTGYIASGSGNFTINAGATFPMELKVTQR